MGLINCKKVSDISIGVTKNQAITSSINGVLFIEPIDSNYVLDAANFTNNSGNIINISGITLTNTTTVAALHQGASHHQQTSHHHKIRFDVCAHLPCASKGREHESSTPATSSSRFCTVQVRCSSSWCSEIAIV